MNFKLPKSKKGVSPIIATLLLIVIAVAAAVVTYSFVMGFIGTSTNPSGQQGQMSIDSATIYANGSFNIYVRNTGSKALTVDAVYINNRLAEGNMNKSLPIGQSIQLLNTNVSGFGLTPGQSYTVKVVCIDGTTVEISKVAQ
ncbi:MAG: archaellin/type IV pilin N-terminal domain-containing protein [Candidatus Methanosuratincola petrocarbonis]